MIFLPHFRVKNVPMLRVSNPDILTVHSLPSLLDDAVLQLCDTRGLDHPHIFPVQLAQRPSRRTSGYSCRVVWVSSEYVSHELALSWAEGKFTSIHVPSDRSLLRSSEHVTRRFDRVLY